MLSPCFSQSIKGGTHIVVSALGLLLPGRTAANPLAPSAAAAAISPAHSSKTIRAMAPSKAAASQSLSVVHRFSVTRAKLASDAENRRRETAMRRHSQ